MKLEILIYKLKIFIPHTTDNNLFIHIFCVILCHISKLVQYKSPLIFNSTNNEVRIPTCSPDVNLSLLIPYYKCKHEFFLNVK